MSAYPDPFAISSADDLRAEDGKIPGIRGQLHRLNVQRLDAIKAAQAARACGDADACARAERLDKRLAIESQKLRDVFIDDWLFGLGMIAENKPELFQSLNVEVRRDVQSIAAVVADLVTARGQY